MTKQWQSLCTTKIVHFKRDNSSIDDTVRTDYKYGISDPKAIGDQILKSIVQDQADTLKKLLLGSFIYRDANKHFDESYQGNHHRKYWQYGIFLTRPTSEVLFFDHSSLFCIILGALQKRNNPELNKAFIDGCQSINADLFKPLNEPTIQVLQDGIVALSRDSQHLSAQKLARDLTTMLYDRPQNPEAAIHHAEFKFRFMARLHSEDIVFKKDTNYKIYAVNAAMLLFGFVPNILYFVFTGNFLFFKQTSQQSSVTNLNKPFVFMQEAIKPNNQEQDEKDINALMPLSSRF